MKSILFVEKNTAALVDEPMPTPGAGQVLVKLAVSTISSGTERANLTGELNISLVERFTEALFPRRGGYSSAGTVIALGEGVTGLVPGDRVALSWSTHCQYVCAEARYAYKLDAATSFHEAALWHISTFPMAAIRKCRLEIGESAIVMGLGVLGRMAVQLLRCAGAVPIIAADPVPEKRAQALANGADYALDPFDPGFADQVKAITGKGVAVAIEVTGNGKALDTVLDCMQPFGRVALLGCTRNSDFSIDYYHKVHGPGITLVGAHTNARPDSASYPGMWTTRDDVLAVQKLVTLGRLRLENLVEEIHSPEEAFAVYHRLATQSAFPLVQFDWGLLE